MRIYNTNNTNSNKRMYIFFLVQIFTVDMKEFDMEEWKSSFYTGCPQYRVGGKLYEDTLSACFL